MFWLCVVLIRKRGRRVSTSLGKQIHLADGQVNELALSTSAYMEDVVGNPNGANYLFQEARDYVSVGTISGKASSFPVFEYQKFPYFSQGSFSHLSPSTIAPSLDDAVTMAAAATNPSKPGISLPVFVAQLKDIPTSLRRFGRTDLFGGKPAVHDSGGVTVDFNFGWDQLYRDVANIFRFTDMVDRRVKQLTAAHGVQGAKGALHVWNDTAFEVQKNLEVWSLEGSVIVDVTKTTTRSMWASVRWFADRPDLPLDASQVLSDARRIVHGWRLSPADVWELIPWSWFIDYFVNVGDFLEAYSNSLGIHSERGCVMLETHTRVTHSVTSKSDWITVVPAEYRYVTRERTPATPTIAFHSVPFLGTKQLLTLSSIILSHHKYTNTYGLGS